MRFIYADPALYGRIGHHAQSAQLLTAALRRRGVVRPYVLAHHAIEPDLKAELDAVPTFRASTYLVHTGEDPLVGWLLTFDQVALLTAQDLLRALPDVDAQDVLYWNSIAAAQLHGITLWLQSLPASKCPRVVCELGTDPGLGAQVVNGRVQGTIPAFQADGRPYLYRYAARKIPDALLPRLSLATFCPESSAAYQELLDLPVSTLPVPRGPVGRRFGRTDTRGPLTVGVIGHQRGEKGAERVADIAGLVLSQNHDVRFLLHNGDAARWPTLMQEWSELAAAYPGRVTVDGRTADERIWAELFDACDLLLLPYDRTPFAFRYSAVACEAVASGVPLVVPDHTSMAALVFHQQYGGDGTLALLRDCVTSSPPGTDFAYCRNVYDGDGPDGVAAAVVWAAEFFSQLAVNAMAGAGKWAATQGPDATVRAMLGLLD